MLVIVAFSQDDLLEITTLGIFILFWILDDLNVSAIIASVVIVALIMASCGLGVYYAQKKGYFSSK